MTDTGSGQLGPVDYPAWTVDLEEARHDPRLAEGSSAAIDDFVHAFREIARSRKASIFALHSVAKLGAAGELVAPLNQAAWERSELARVEVGNDFPWINASTLWSLHSALDDLVERLAPSMADGLSAAFAEHVMRRVEADYPERVPQVPAEMRDYIVRSLQEFMRAYYKTGKPRGNGAGRWEAPLRAVRMGAPPDVPVPVDLDFAMQELCVLRDVLTHRGGRIDESAARDWPGERLTVGSFVRITSPQARQYSAAVAAYGYEVIRRLLAAAGEPTTPKIDNWTSYAFSV